MNFEKLRHYCLVPVGAFFFIIFALYNNYAVVNGDSLTYLQSGFTLQPPDERPIFYGLFMRISSLGVSLWLTLFFQSLLLSYVLVHFIKRIVPAIDSLKVIAILLMLSLGTILSWYASQIMPDIFTGILFFALANFLLFPNTKKQAAIYLSIAFVAILTHFSHYLIITLFTLAILAGSFVFVKMKKYRRKSLVVLSVSVVAWLSLYTSNYMGGKGFVSSNVSHVFLMGKLAESGVLKTYLDKACPTKPYRLCHYKNDLPPVAWEFVWDQQSSPVFKEGGWHACRDEYNTIIRDIASRPKYWPFLAFKSMEATARQIVLTNIDEGEERDWIKFEPEHPLYQGIEKYYPHEINEFRVSKQNYRTMLNFRFYDDLYVIVLTASSIMMLTVVRTDMKQDIAKFYALMILFLLVNAFVTATFGNVLTRLNSRIIWILPAMNIIFLFKIFMKRNQPQRPDFSTK